MDKRIKERKDKKENGFKLINKDYNPDKFIEPEGRVDYQWEKNENKDMNRILIRLTESDLRRIVKESAHRLLTEYEPD